METQVTVLQHILKQKEENKLLPEYLTDNY